ncbi:c-type cytochrome [Sphingosinicella sp. LHD-64]|uniref:c-type cytochrome n=1 Tax=Sphingosinicella sp. LHD-64 TaxID=3072139 RepID=UPI00280EA420|nr:c-type cytochrome [Sphingosinicella sp. LHD-64]MDQ8758341.1 c-type cytochrome [Sphingosinicella sp. LHD-64]
MNDRFNTIAGWALGAGIVLLGGTLVTGEIFKAERPETMGYPIAGVEEEGGEAGEAEQPIAHFLQTADAARGEAVFRKCAACHNTNQGGANGLGPNLFGVMGEAIASPSRAFAFSSALTDHGGTWDWENMSAWLKSPRNFAQGTKMTFAGLSDPQDRADIMLYLNQHGGRLTIPPPPAADAPAEGGDAAAPAGNAAAPADNAAAPAAGNAAEAAPGNAQ